MSVLVYPALLTAEDLVALTGAKQPKRMCAWLDSRGWVYEPPARRGELPRVARAYHDARLGCGPVAAPASAARPKPNFDFMLTPATT